MGTLIGYAAAPLPADALLQWIASFRQVCPNNRVILLADPAEAYASLTDFFDVEVVQTNLHSNPFDVPPGTESFRGCVSVYKDRWRAVAELELPDDESVLLTDTRDVLFQRDPFAGAQVDGVLVATEGELFRHNPWNRAMLDRYFPEYRAIMADFPTICAGVVGGRFRHVKDMAQQITKLCNEKTGMAEQAAVNIVLRTSKLPVYIAKYDRSAWCAHCASIISPWAIARPTPKTEEIPVLLRSGHLANRSGRLFAVVHHWPMVPQLRHFEKVGVIS